RAASVPGSGAMCSSQRAAVSVRSGSMATTCAPRAWAWATKGHWCRFADRRLAPHSTISRASTIDSGSKPTEAPYSERMAALAADGHRPAVLDRELPDARVRAIQRADAEVRGAGHGTDATDPPAYRAPAARRWPARPVRRTPARPSARRAGAVRSTARQRAGTTATPARCARGWPGRSRRPRAGRLNVATKTVANNVSSIFAKLG